MRVRYFGYMLLISLLITITASAESTYESIACWQDGHGMTADGKPITDGWGYDEKSVAGKYVLFDEEGNVQQKRDSIEKELSPAEQFTDTESENGKVAVRGKVFDGFEGKVYVSFVQRGNGPVVGLCLTKGKMYMENMNLSDGTYDIDVQAEEEGKIYEVEYDLEQLDIRKGMVVKVDIAVKKELKESKSMAESQELEVAMTVEESPDIEEIKENAETDSGGTLWLMILVILFVVVKYGAKWRRKGGNNGKKTV